MRNIIIIFFIFNFLIINVTPVFAKESDAMEKIQEEIKWLQAEAIISITTKHDIPISRAPGIVTVIMARQIREMGLRTLSDVLKIVPGFDITMIRNGMRTISVRGYERSGGNKVKVLIDGHSVNEPMRGSATWVFDDLVIENAKKIEVIRGPGSALYGQNAFLAVVNVITKDLDDINGFQWTASGDSFDTQNYSMLFGKEIKGLEVSGYFDYYNTQGASEKIEQDILFPATFSKSPGRSHNKKEKTDLNLKLSYKGLELKGKYTKKRREDYIGLGYALNDDSNIVPTYIFSELSYKLSLGERLAMAPKVYYDQYNRKSFWENRPDGFILGGRFVYPDGIQGLTSLKTRTIGFEDQFNYNVFEGNDLTFGFQYEWIHMHDVRSGEWTAHPLTFLPLPYPQDFSDDLPFMRKRVTRQIWSLYLQDEWSITDDIDLTVGVRHDQYNRFAGTTNPRFGMVWRFMQDAHLKLLFATAFRAPDLSEMFVANNPSRIGNPSLEPEKINTFEVGVGYNFTKNINGNINYFYNRMRDLIVLVPNVDDTDRFENVGGMRMIGVEAEIRADFGEDNYVFANYTFQDAEETRNRDRIPDVPMHKANFGVNLGLTKYVNMNLHTFLNGPRQRIQGDTRRDIPSHALVNLTLIGKNFWDNLEIRGSVNNLFDNSYDDPAPPDTVPTDFPQPGRLFILEMKYTW